MPAHGFDVTYSQLVRDMRQLEDVVEAVEAGHVMLTSVNGDIDLLTDNGRMVARIKAAVARNELEKLSRRVRRQKLQRAQRGIKNQGPVRTFGYRRDFRVVPREAAVLVELFERRAAGESVTSLARWLNAARIKTSRGKVGNWAFSTVTDMLRRREYIGEVTLNGEVVGKANFEAIIDRATFERAKGQSSREPAAWRLLKEFGLLTGLLICGVCGAKMKRGRGQTSERLYACTSHGSTLGGRTYLSVSADAVVLEAVWLKARQLNDAGSAQPWLSAQAAAIDHEIDQAQRMHARGELTRAALETVLHHLRGRLAEERSRPAEPPPDGAQPDDWDTWDIDTQRRWLAQLVSHVVVAVPTRRAHGPHVECGRLTVHFKDGDARNLGRKEVVMADVARLAGCSKDHASHALNGTGDTSAETRARVRAAAEELGYIPVGRRTGSG